MVPREKHRNASKNSARSTLSGLFGAWRSFLGSLPTKLRPALRAAPADSPKAAIGARPPADWSVKRARSYLTRPERALVLGLAATTIGALATQLVTPPRGLAQGLALAVVHVMWVVARLLVMRLANGSSSTVRDGALTQAWAAGALVQVVAVTPPLRTLAWAVGAFLSLRVLLRSGASSRDSLRLVLWGYGVEVAGFFLVAIGRSVDVAVRVFLGGQ